jgi:hypothetical protein
VLQNLAPTSYPQQIVEDTKSHYVILSVPWHKEKCVSLDAPFQYVAMDANDEETDHLALLFM